MSGRMWSGFKKKRAPRQVWSDWQAANEANDVESAERFASELLDVAPEVFFSWFEAGLLSKARGNWAESAERNQRALALFTETEAAEFGGANPAAWNLGIAATALGDWATARTAWAAYGLTGFDNETGPIDDNYGMTPVRINPDRASLPHQLLPPFGETEVVWCWRRSPAHAVITSVPMPGSGHRFRDILLHDGEPQGTRFYEGREVSVFNELERLESSEIPTWQAQITGAGKVDLQVLADTLARQGIGLDEWSGIRMMCSDCSHGSPREGHDHAAPASDASVLGLAGFESDLDQVMDEWRRSRPAVDVVSLELLW
ncbi:M48 family metallopeptidase [Paenarthrobacter sp. YJN-5]|uniref:tetratricopeptide repeat protein n=1 Tax=Paenarthrobacter sp. YJN-5 TaxID=2735316 RepID=UPI0018777A0F|nr:tetratricopeptide repeat protein [Paenarthrobacter sp. YJN-5]QOT19419.1 tetratricopeptide repeat protein [Paenarthrobacter sp. YJN-5]